MAKSCPSCGYQPIGPFTDNCPICAEPVRNVRSDGRRASAAGLHPLTRWLMFGAVAVLLSCGGCCGFGLWRGNKAVKEFEKEVEQANADAEADRKRRTVAVSAAQLLEEYQTDPVAADRKYKGKHLEVSGVVERSGMDRDDVPFLILHAGDEKAKLRIESFFDVADDDEEEQIKRLMKGQTITVRGEYSGQVSNVQLRDCVLVK